MPDRASHLAKLILDRMADLETHEHNGSVDDQRRQELVTKILAIYAGITDGPTVQLVASALPSLARRKHFSDRKQDDFAKFLRQRVRVE